MKITFNLKTIYRDACTNNTMALIIVTEQAGKDVDNIKKCT